MKSMIPSWKESSFMLSSQAEATKQKDALASEVASLRLELQQVRDDRDRQLSQVQTLTFELVKFKDSTEKSCSELDSLTIITNELEAKCTLQDNQIKALQEQLTTAEKKLQKLVKELQRCLTDAEYKLVEGEKLWKELHNTILGTSAFSVECGLCYLVKVVAQKGRLYLIPHRWKLLDEALN